MLATAPLSGRREEDNVCRLWDATTGKNRLTLRLAGRVEQLAISLDGTALAVVRGRDGIQLFDANTGESIRTLGRGFGFDLRAAFAPDGKPLPPGDGPGPLTLTAVARDGPRRPLSPPPRAG